MVSPSPNGNYCRDMLGHVGICEFRGSRNGKSRKQEMENEMKITLNPKP